VEEGGTVSVEPAEEAHVIILPPLADPPRKKKNKADRMLEKAFNILTASAAVPAVDECCSFRNLTGNKFPDYSSCARNAVQHAINNIIFNTN
jgi:hypothetical protein